MLEPLLPLARDGNEAATGTLDRLLRPHLEEESDRRFRATGGHLSSQDFVQETLTAAFRELPNHRGQFGEASFWAWLDAILANRVKNWIRHDTAKKRPPVGGGLEGTPEPPARDPSPSADFAAIEAAAERNRRIAAALAKLDPVDRELVVGRYFGGLTSEQLAEKFQDAIPDLTDQRVRDRLKRARDKLRVLLGDAIP